MQRLGFAGCTHEQFSELRSAVWLAPGQPHGTSVTSSPSTHLHGHLPHDVVRREDGLKVQPRRLHLEPVVHDVLEVVEGLLPLHDSVEERPYIPGLERVHTSVWPRKAGEWCQLVCEEDYFARRHIDGNLLAYRAPRLKYMHQMSAPPTGRWAPLYSQTGHSLPSPQSGVERLIAQGSSATATTGVSPKHLRLDNGRWTETCNFRVLLGGRVPLPSKICFLLRLHEYFAFEWSHDSPYMRVERKPWPALTISVQHRRSTLKAHLFYRLSCQVLCAQITPYSSTRSICGGVP